jgi:hypothetical protein
MVMGPDIFSSNNKNIQILSSECTAEQISTQCIYNTVIKSPKYAFCLCPL